MKSEYSVFITTPSTFLLSANLDDHELQEFTQRFKELAKGFSLKEKLPQKHCEKNIWLVKPAAANQGKGIEIFQNYKDIISFIGTKPSQSYWVVQKYIERPLLFFGRKFDFRIWVLVTENMEVYFYRQGYLRTSSADYDINNMHDNFVHLTNNCLQKFGDNYGKHEDGNTLSYEVL